LRKIVWFSCGAASAVAAKIATQQYDDCLVAYCDTSSTEHPDNLRFLRDVEKWIGQPILMLKSDKYKDTWDVWNKTRYLVGVAGARCTSELKRAVREKFQREDDIHVFGYTLEERHRAERFEKSYPELDAQWILIENELSKDDCLGFLWKAGIEIPAMYKLGFRNNNCIGCVKGSSGYWVKTRKIFPEVFKRMALLERELNVAINKKYVKGERVRVFLDELPENAGRYEDEPDISCGIMCQSAYDGLEIEPIELPECET
tara:strand:+ start:376 stop:1152 length:777 start_codon:yes stop_codon:yes gene_type:complete